jgi:outer membrane protein OmpA-like peptidoglycan-associated protein
VLLTAAVATLAALVAQPVPRAEALATSSEETGIIGDETNDQLWLAQLWKLGAQSDGRGWVLPLTTANYPPDTASFRPSSVVKIDETARLLREFSGARAVYTDSRGPSAVNKRLSQARAEAVCEYLRQQGVDANHVQAIGLADREPIASNTTSWGRAKNRRVDVMFSDARGRFRAIGGHSSNPRSIRPIYGHHPLHRPRPLGEKAH